MAETAHIRIFSDNGMDGVIGDFDIAEQTELQSVQTENVQRAVDVRVEDFARL